MRSYDQIIILLTGENEMATDLFEHFENLNDPRIDSTKIYPLMEIILLVLVGTLSGCDLKIY